MLAFVCNMIDIVNLSLKHIRGIIMTNSAVVYARIDPNLKTEVEEILTQLGVTPSTAVQMLYNQIKLTRSIPFPIKLPDNKPIFSDTLTSTKLNRELEKGYNCIVENKIYTINEVDEFMKKNYGI